VRHRAGPNATVRGLSMMLINDHADADRRGESFLAG
jgi:hypothetical protein